MRVGYAGGVDGVNVACARVASVHVGCVRVGCAGGVDGENVACARVASVHVAYVCVASVRVECAGDVRVASARVGCAHDALVVPVVPEQTTESTRRRSGHCQTVHCRGPELSRCSLVRGGVALASGQGVVEGTMASTRQ